MSVNVISDGDGVAVVGEQSEVDEFLASLALTSRASRINSAPSEVASSSGIAEITTQVTSWISATEEVMQLVQDLGIAPTKVKGIAGAVLEKSSKARGWIQAVNPGSVVAANPAVLTGVAGVMAQTALEASLKEITDYLALIDRKLDDVLRSQTNAVLARVDGVRFAVNEANAIRAQVGKVSDVTWSKIQATSISLLETESYALRQIQDESEAIRMDGTIAELSQAVEASETNIPMWLTILANCASLHDSIAILELERVMHSEPDDLDNHRIGLKAARTSRHATIAQALEGMLTKVNGAVDRANSSVLLNPIQTPRTIESCRTIALSIVEISTVFGLTTEEQKTEARRWIDAASEKVETTRKVTAETAQAVQQVSKDASATAKVLKGKVADKLNERKLRKQSENED